MLPSRDLAWSWYYNKSSFFPWEICIVPAQDNVRIAPADGKLGVLIPEHDIFIQLMKLKNTLRWMRGETLITHLGLEYYD
jgi:hypothetical protein